MPRVIIVAGPNGAGKTTFAREFLPREGGCRTFLNADLIAAGLSPFAPERAAIHAGRLMLQSIAALANAGESFAFETTLSGLGYAKQIPVWQDRGYRVELFFVSLPSADVAVHRVTLRVSQGGHDIPEATIRRRFEAGRRNLLEVYQPLVDEWSIHDNSGDGPQLVEWGSKEMARRTEEPAPKYGDLPANVSSSIRGAFAALQRSARRAREIALQTGTDLVIVRDGKLVRVNPRDMTTR